MNTGQKNHVRGAVFVRDGDGKMGFDVAAGNNALMDVNFVAGKAEVYAGERQARALHATLFSAARSGRSAG